MKFCKHVDDIAQEDHSYVATWQERQRYEKGCGSCDGTAKDLRDLSIHELTIPKQYEHFVKLIEKLPRWDTKLIPPWDPIFKSDNAQENSSNTDLPTVHAATEQHGQLIRRQARRRLPRHVCHLQNGKSRKHNFAWQATGGHHTTPRASHTFKHLLDVETRLWTTLLLGDRVFFDVAADQRGFHALCGTVRVESFLKTGAVGWEVFCRATQRCRSGTVVLLVALHNFKSSFDETATMNQYLVAHGHSSRPVRWFNLAANRRFQWRRCLNVWCSFCSSRCLSGRSRCKASRRCDTVFGDMNRPSSTDRFHRNWDAVVRCSWHHFYNLQARIDSSSVHLLMTSSSVLRVPSTTSETMIATTLASGLQAIVCGWAFYRGLHSSVGFSLRDCTARDVLTGCAHFTHANIFSRVAQGSEWAPARDVFLHLPEMVPFVIFVSHVSRTVIVVWLPCLLFHSTFLLCFFPRAVLNPAIHGQEDSLVDWPNKVLSQRHRAQRHCRVQRLHPCSCHQDEQISFRRTDLVRTLQLHLCFRKSMRDKACECWLHRCSCSRENQVQLQQEFVTLTDKVLCQARLTLKAQGALLRFTHTKRTSSRDPKSIIFAEHQSVRDYRNERIETGVPVKTRKGKPFSVERKQGECYLRISVEKATQSAFLAPKSQTQNDGKSCWKGKALRGRSPSGKRSRRPCAKTTSVESARIRHVVLGILPYVNITKHNRDANSVKHASFGTKRSTISPTRSRRKVVVKVLLLSWRILSNWAVYFRLWSVRNPSRVYGMAPNPWDQNVACMSQKVQYST